MNWWISNSLKWILRFPFYIILFFKFSWNKILNKNWRNQYNFLMRWSILDNLKKKYNIKVIIFKLYICVYKRERKQERRILLCSSGVSSLAFWWWVQSSFFLLLIFMKLTLACYKADLQQRRTEIEIMCSMTPNRESSE